MDPRVRADLGRRKWAVSDPVDRGILAGGEVAEWPKAPLSKSGSALKVLVGSNPTLSANAPRRFAPLFSV